jgi:SP family general alpha glucoside:H+ symporter-like MFS transporter
VNNPTQWSYRIPFAVQWIWPVPLFVTLFFCPESPWFLVRAGRLQEAERSLKRLSAKSHEVDHQKTIALMVHTTELERRWKPAARISTASRVPIFVELRSLAALS